MDVSLYEIRRRLQTLGELLGRDVVLAPRNYLSTRRCSQCGHVVPPLDTRKRTYCCPVCGNTIDRDLNAAINLRNLIGGDTPDILTEDICPMRSDLIRSSIQHSQIDAVSG